MPDPENIPLIGPVYRASTIEEAREIPIIGNAIGTINAVTNFTEYGCYPHWTVWVDTLWKPAGKAILQLIGFGWGDVLRGYFRPTNIRGIGGRTRVPTRGKKNKPGKKGGGRRIPRPPEIGNEIGKALPGSKFFQGRKVTGWERIVWVIDSQIQRIFWYWLVADVTEDFITNWTTAIMESEACKKPPFFSLSASKAGATPMSPQAWTRILFWDTDSQEGPDLWNAQAGVCEVPGDCIAYVTAWSDITVLPPGTSSGNELRVHGPTSAVGARTLTRFPANDDDNPDEPTIAAEIKGPSFVAVDLFAHADNLCHYHDSRLTISIVQVPPTS